MTIQVSPSSIPNSDTVSLTSTLLDRDAYLTGLLNQLTASKTDGLVAGTTPTRCELGTSLNYPHYPRGRMAIY